MPANNENPKMKTFLDDDKSQYFKLEIPTPVTRPNMIQKRPPLTGILRLDNLQFAVTRTDKSFSVEKRGPWCNQADGLIIPDNNWIRHCHKESRKLRK